MKDPRTFKKPYVHSAYSHLVHRHSQICTPSHTHTQTHTHSHSTKTSFWYAVLFWFQTTCRYIESSPEQQGCFQQLIFTLSVDCSAMVTVPSQSELWSFLKKFYTHDSKDPFEMSRHGVWILWFIPSLILLRYVYLSFTPLAPAGPDVLVCCGT